MNRRREDVSMEEIRVLRRETSRKVHNSGRGEGKEDRVLFERQREGGDRLQ